LIATIRNMTKGPTSEQAWGQPDDWTGA